MYTIQDEKLKDLIFNWENPTFYPIENVKPSEADAVEVPFSMEKRLVSLNNLAQIATNYAQVANVVMVDCDEETKVHVVSVLEKNKQAIKKFFEMNHVYILMLSGYILSFQEEIGLSEFIKKSKDIYEKVQKELGL